MRFESRNASLQSNVIKYLEGYIKEEDQEA